ncbi:putative non-specific serine/threonine protein kinase [Helianthus debilis subsp. tardiflorus]
MRVCVRMSPPLFLLLLIIIQYASCELPSFQLTTMNTLLQQLQTHNHNSKWNSSSQDLTNPCSWTGVLCNPNNSFITGLSLSSFSLFDISNDYSWSSRVYGIETLEKLDVSNNQLAAIAPPLLLSSCGGGLKVLNFSNNMLSGNIPSFQRSLERLDLSHNFLHGVIPDQITELVNLSVLDLSYNQLNGPIPYGIGQLSKLEQLILSANNLAGEIPTPITLINTLKRFSANQNAFTGAVPLGIIRYLSYLDLSYNRLTGSVPGNLLSQPNLLTVDLSFNKLEGSIPVNVSKNLVRLRLGSNQSSGGLPSWSFGNEVLEK